MANLLVLIAGAALSGCAGGMESRVDAGLADTPIGQESGSLVASSAAPADIAIAVEEKLKATEYMRQRVVARDADGEVEILSHMAEDRFRTEVYEDGTLIMAYSMLDGRIQEFKPTLDRRPFIEYDAPRQDGADDSVFKHRWDCFTGAHIATWLGRGSNHRQSFFRRQIESATLVGVEALRDRDCFVLRHSWTVGEQSLSHTFHVDSASWLILRWTRNVNDYTSTHDFLEVEVANDVPADVEWSVKPLVISDK